MRPSPGLGLALAALALVLLAIVQPACTRMQDGKSNRPPGGDETPSGSRDTSTTGTGMSPHGASSASGTAAGSDAGTSSGGSARESAGKPSPAPADGDTFSVRQVMDAPGIVGRTVIVGGRCLGYGSIKAEGASPVTRSDWQLEDQDAAIWVTGPMPDGCSPTQGSAVPVHIRARVAADTIRSLGTGDRKTRRYLVHLAH